MKQLAGKIHTDAPTIYGDTTWGELLDSVKSAPNKVIHSLEDPVAKNRDLKSCGKYFSGRGDRTSDSSI